ncbi:arginine--tRNA ligase [Falsibacillus albus]|uniref:arginine--tRNA ligase n=1 Tax=Falsibacillus albus TaxID=2478915 RepID=UPI003898E4AE
MDLKKIFTEKLLAVLPESLEYDSVYSMIETPKHASLGDLAFPCFQLAKTLQESPASIAAEFSSKLHSPYFSKVIHAGPYVNVFFDPAKAGSPIVNHVLEEGTEYGSGEIGSGKTVVLDMSSPNIAKPFSMGHLRSTVIGNALASLAEKNGYRPIKINYLGDWGTQFGKLIVAYRKWGDPEKVKQNPIGELLKLYVQFHHEAEQSPALEDEGRKAFKDLESGEPDHLELWKWFRDESLKSFMEIYGLLGITFDNFQGEAFYNDKMSEAVQLLKEKDLLVQSDGAEVVLMDEEGMPPCLIKKSDGASLYPTRDLAAAIYRQREYQFDQALYVVGQEQRVHFNQVFSVLKKMGFEWADAMKHVPFGLYLKNGKKMSTRKGRVILLENVIKEAIALALKNINEKNPDLHDAEKTARAVGVGAIIFHDLKNDRMNNIEFSLSDMLTFEGETGPYIQYTHARAQSILRKAPPSYTFHGLGDEASWEVIKQLRLFPETVERSYLSLAPSVLAKYLIDLSKSFNKYYGKVRILEENDELTSRVSLVKAVAIVLAEGLRLLGIEAPNEM